MTLYGIKNCDTVQKTMKWLTKHKKSFRFHDYKLSGIDESTLKSWCKQVGWEQLLNKRSTTWRELGDNVQATVTNEKAAIRIMLENNSIIKRPVITEGSTIVVVGFNEAEYAKKFR
jgi:Spx/MgsR family transcriptional regulator